MKFTLELDIDENALAEASSLVDVKAIIDKSAGIIAYARSARNTELLREAVELNLRAMRRAGQILLAMPKNKGGRPRRS